MRLHDNRITQDGAAQHRERDGYRRRPRLVGIPCAQADMKQIGGLIVREAEFLLPSASFFCTEGFLLVSQHLQMRGINRKIAIIPHHRSPVIAD
jgi:hypothetical protein